MINDNQFLRNEMLLGDNITSDLSKTTVMIIGLGGVGSYTVETLARLGVGHFVLIDKDKVEISNINRQIIATFETIGEDKVEIAKKRILSINPKATVDVE
ncbi:MAG: ThiF family adenylyltransferase, partial [Bacilli bacterium]|nr:ThiF family adenylyltransferase [Bacilli bacterium]